MVPRLRVMMSVLYNNRVITVMFVVCSLYPFLNVISEIIMSVLLTSCSIRITALSVTVRLT